MSAKKTNISQLKKYLAGELDTRAMHQLERQAQDDPFLMDALDGFEQAGGWQQPAMDDLDNRLQHRVAKGKQRKLAPWLYLAAATVLITLTVGYLLWPQAKVAEVGQAKLAIKTPPAENIVTAKIDTLIKPPAKQQMIAALKPKIKRQPEFKQTTAVAAPAVAAEPAADVSSPRQMLAEVSVAPPADTVRSFAAVIAKNRRADTNQLHEVMIRGGATLTKNATSSVSALPVTALQGKVEGVQVTTPEGVTGHVYNEFGQPLVGVQISVAGKPTSITDASGKFIVPVTADKQTLAFNYIGYNSTEVKASSKDNLNIAMQPNNAGLNEVVVVGYGANKKVADVKEAHPVIGWDAYKNYLKRRAVLPNGITGKVDLTFTVDEKGALGNFKIIHQLNDQANQKAVDLVKNGPVWLPNKNGKPQTQSLTIKFNKPE